MRLKPVLFAVVVAGCAPPAQETLTLSPATFADLPGWVADTHADAIQPLLRSCAVMQRRTPITSDRARRTDAAEWQMACAAAKQISPRDNTAARAFFERWFVPHLASAGRRAGGLFTGYYEPELNGSRVRSDRYAVPIYVKPSDLVSVDLGLFRRSLKGERIAGRLVDGRLTPYASRAEIEAGRLRGRELELVWVDDAVDAFFLHIQGSGRIALVGGGMLRIGYAASNGHPYTAIGGQLIGRGAIAREDMSMQSIRSWLAANPDEAVALMNTNASFVFFRELDGEGPLGTQGVVLTPGRSLAVDRRFVALGLPIWLDTTDPLDPEKPLRRLLVAQDTGGAIRGAVRGDIFWGHGLDAAARAGRMRQTGRYFVLLPRQPAAVTSR